jgi:hypothetical protein
MVSAGGLPRTALRRALRMLHCGSS